VRSSEYGAHDYFLTEPGSLASEEYTRVQNAFATEYGGDKQVKDTARVMRLPGMFHRKTNTPFLCEVVCEHDAELPVYLGADLVEAFCSDAQITSKAGGSRESAVASLASGNILPTKQRYSLLQVADALRSLSNEADDRKTWIDYGHALKRQFREDGRSVWLNWSKQSDQFDEDDAEKKWNSFRVAEGEGGSCPITVGTIIHAAKSKGWLPDGTSSDPIAWPEVKNGKADAGSIENATFFLKEKGVQPWLNEFDGKVFIQKESGESEHRLNDSILRDLRLQAHTWGLRAPPDLFSDAVLWVAGKCTAHPVRNYLSDVAREWDGKKRLDTWLSDYAGACDTPYTRAIGPKWLIAGARRVREPGCKFDNMLVLEGPQNAGKSSVFAALASTRWFVDSVNVGDDPRKVIEDTAGAWIVECPEMSGMGRREVETVQAFMSRQRDRARGAYDRHVSDIPRQFIMGGTTNATKYLLDKTGNRRFWCVSVGVIELKALRRDRDQLWAEAAIREAEGERIYLTSEEYDLVLAEQKTREVVDPMEERLSDLLSDIYAGFIVTEDLYAAVGLQDVSRRKDHHAARSQ
jgi:Virulence-associated protein E-like domain/Primase C terminal 2 (PriCT-2)